MMIHHHGSIKNQKHRGFATDTGYTQQTFHSKCRRHPYRFLRHGRSRISPPPPWFDETPPPPSTSHADISPPAPSFHETPPLKTAQAPETPNIPSVAKCWRSGILHLENPVSKRWRSDTLHPETPVPTTTPPQLRWRAGVLRALRPFRRLRDKQPDPSEVSVKRPRWATAQVMSTTLVKRCDWSLGPVFDEINKDSATRFFSHTTCGEKRGSFCFRASRKSAFVACGHGTVNGRNGRSTRQHCH